MPELKRYLLAVSLFLLLASPVARAIELGTVHPNEIIARYGKPDRIESTEYDRPRPPLVTRFLEYKKQHVRFAFLADAPVGSPPPYAKWKLIGTQDPRDNSVLSATEATERMKSREKK